MAAASVLCSTPQLGTLMGSCRWAYPPSAMGQEQSGADNLWADSGAGSWPDPPSGHFCILSCAHAHEALGNASSFSPGPTVRILAQLPDSTAAQAPASLPGSAPSAAATLERPACLPMSVLSVLLARVPGYEEITHVRTAICNSRLSDRKELSSGIIRIFS